MAKPAVKSDPLGDLRATHRNLLIKLLEWLAETLPVHARSFVAIYIPWVLMTVWLSIATVPMTSGAELD